MHTSKSLRSVGHHSPSHRPARIVNGPTYTAGRRRRAALSVLLPAAVLRQWLAPAPAGARGRGAVDRFTDAAITALLGVKLALGLSYSAVVGLVRDHFRTRGVRLPVPDESTLCRRAQRLGQRVGRPLPGGLPGVLWVLSPGPGPRPTGVVIDSTGLAIRGPGTWRSGRPHGREADVGRTRTWLKLHLAVDPVTGQVLAAAATPPHLDDGRVGAALLHALRTAGHRLQVVAADGAYDTRGVYAAAVQAGCTQVLVPPGRNAGVWDPHGRQATAGAAIRNAHWAATVAPTADLATARRAAWKADVGYHVRSLVESAMARIGARTGSRCRLRSAAGRLAEVAALVALLNRDAALGQPVRVRRAWAATWPSPAARAA